MSSPEQITKGIADSSFILVYQLKQSVFMEDELLPTTSYQAVHRTVEWNCIACEIEELRGEGVVSPSLEV